jgi:amino acid adenylation domain-containing protein
MTPMLPEAFLAQAQETPDAPAVLTAAGTVTYRELARAARRVGHALTTRGVGPESTVGVLVEPGPDLVAALLGIWLAGGAYVPLDPHAPAARREAVVALAGAEVVLTGIDDLAGDPGWTPARVTAPRQAAYLIFTSGSTGTPKGVVVEHDGIANRVRWGVSALGLAPGDRVLQKTPLTFDAAGWEIMAPLVAGAAVAFGGPGAGRDPGELVAAIRARRATVVQVVPSMLRLLAVEPHLGDCTSLRVLCSAGEPLHAELCHRILDRIDVRILNTYGPTECAIDVSAAWFDPAQLTGPVPIGFPIDNIRHLLLPDGEPVRELYACGVGVARGYHGDPARTAERFVPDPSGPPGARMYRTGDLVRTRDDGALEFAGRADDQVKINGVRIEPGEVEAAIAAHPGVLEAAVTAVTDPHGNRHLAAFVVGEPAGLTDHLRDRLPPALVPAIVTTLPALPRTTSGKTDRGRLPEPDWSTTSTGAAPRTAEERIVLAAWQQVLGTDADEVVGLDDDFFRVGGHSLLMTRLAALITETSGLALDFRELHYTTTVRGQARLLARAAASSPIEPLPAGARVPLSPAQERFWVLDRMDPGSREYLLPVLFWLPADVAAEVVEQALAHLVARHEALRTRYVMDGEGLAAVVEPAAAVPLRTVDTTAAEVAKVVAAELAEGFDLATAPLLRATLVRDGGDEQLLFLACHHICCDGWSEGILERELRAAIAALRDGRAPVSPEQPIRYADAVAWQRSQLTDDVLAEALGYWRETLDGLPVLALPTVRARDEQRGIDGAAVAVDLPAATADQLLAVGRDAGTTPFVVFLTLWSVLVARTSGQWDFGVGTPHSGRYRPELHDLVGLFIDTVVVRSRLSPDQSFAEAVAVVESTCRDAFAHHAAPFDAVVDAVASPRDPSRTPLYQTYFTVAGGELLGPQRTDEDIELLRQAWTVARTDLSLTMWPYPDGRYVGAIEYASALFDEAMATGMAGRLRALAEWFAADPGLAIGAAGLDETEPGSLLDEVLGFVRALLKQDDVGQDEDVMTRGGNSLLAARLLWQVQEAFGVEVSMRAFFDRPTAAGLTDEVERLLAAESQ